MTNFPEVSVVMGVRNGGARLVPTVESILAQSDVHLELIAVENHSTDATLRQLEDFADRDPRVRVLESEERGLTRALIRGCAAARAPWIARQDCGDLSDPSRLARQLAALRESQAVLATCGVTYTGPAGEWLYRVVPADGPILRESLLHDAPGAIRGLGHHGSAVFSRAAYERAGGYRAQFWFAQDLDLWIRLAGEGSIVTVPEVLYTATVTPEALSSLHRREQDALTSIAVALRDGTGNREELLTRASQTRPGEHDGLASPAPGNYFIGRCLQANGDARARRYLAACVRSNPLHWRGWAALARELFRT